MNFPERKRLFFTTQLLNWHRTDNNRDLPWKQEKDPYKIWLSEIILQQTRALQGLPYYIKFTTTYPTVKDMAAAPDEEVFRIWQGLGYYNRCKNMLATARYITNELGGTFPATYEGIMTLKGIGPYTAAAIASFAYNLPHAVVDGNVYRVLARYFDIDTPFDTTNGKKIFAGLAQQLIDPAQSSAYNQAIMDLGATVCTPRNPNCTECLLNKQCAAAGNAELIALLPVRSKKVQVATRHFNYLVLKHNDQLWLRKRSGKDIWENLYEPLLIETDSEYNDSQLAMHPEAKAFIAKKKIGLAGKGKQRLTHRIIESRFYIIELGQKPTDMPENGQWVELSKLGEFAYPKTVLTFLNSSGLLP